MNTTTLACAGTDRTGPSRRSLYRRGKRVLVRLLAGRWRGPRRELEPAVRHHLAPYSRRELWSLLRDRRVALAAAAVLLATGAAAAEPPIELSDVAAGTGGFVIKGIDADDLSGWSVSGAGDVNGDGRDDLVVGARWADPGGVDRAGESYVVFGKAGTASVDLADVAAGTGGFVIDGIDADDSSGFSVSGAGDVNGDGLDDVIVGAYGAAPGGVIVAGESYVVFGKADGAAVDLADVAAGTGGFAINGIDAFGYSGFSVSGAGDVNGDGLDDLVVGAWAASVAPFSYEGESYVVFGKAGTAPVELADVAAGTGGFVIHGIDPSDYAGYSVSGAGDVNGDGLDDVILGAIGADPGGDSYAGESYVVFGRTATTAVDLADVAAGTGGFVISGIDPGDYSGYSVSGAGDVNGDGLDDVVVGAFGADPGGDSSAGESYVVFGKADGAAVNLANVVAGTGGFVINGIDAEDLSGWSVAAAGDVNGDGRDDLIVGAPGADRGGTADAGESYVVFGKTDGAAVDLADVVTGAGGFVLNGIDADDFSGWSVSGAGDVNGDGRDDLIVGAPGADQGGAADAGESYVVFAPGPAPPCLADCAGVADGAVDVTDLLAVLAQWSDGPTPGVECDVDDGSATGTPDGVTNVSDLLFVLGAWGPCP